MCSFATVELYTSSCRHVTWNCMRNPCHFRLPTLLLDSESPSPSRPSHTALDTEMSSALMYDQLLVQEKARQHNQSSKLRSLPDELIIEILQLLLNVPDEHWSTEDISEYRDIEFMIDPSGTCMMLVCSHIRAVALVTPFLWTYIDCTAPSRWVGI
jgi:hypothetical protein